MKKVHKTTMKLPPQLGLFLLICFEISLASKQANHYYVPTEDKWQEEVSAHAIIKLQDQTNEDFQNAECAAYCTSRDSKFE